MIITLNQPRLVKIEYTNEECKLFPHVSSFSHENDIEKFLEAKQIGDINRTIGISLSFDKIGRFKREEWRFQSEWRYIITVLPMGLREYGLSESGKIQGSDKLFTKQQETLKRLVDPGYVLDCNRIFLELDEHALQDIEVLCGPRMSPAGKIIVRALLDKFCPSGKCNESKLRIR